MRLYLKVLAIACVGVLILENSLAQSKKIPRSPCPDIFRYERIGDLRTGSIDVTGITYGTTVLEVQLSQKGTHPLRSGGHLSVEDEDTIHENIDDEETITYHVDFPQLNVVPRVTSIKLNGTEICSGRPYTRPSKKIILKHILKTKADRDQSEEYPQSHEESKIIYLYPGNDYIVDEKSKPQNIGYGNVPSAYPISTTSTQTPRKKNINSDHSSQFSANPTNPFLNRAISNALNDDLFGGPTEPVLGSDIHIRNSHLTTTTLPERFTFVVPSDVMIPVLSATPPSSNQSTMEHINLVCGQENSESTSTRLNVQGDPIAMYRFPWIVAVFRKNGKYNEFQCGGSLISTRTVVTAAHCFYMGRQAMQPEDIILYMGRHNLSDASGSIEFDVESLIIHPDFKPTFSTLDGDLAVVITKQSVTFTISIRPICLWEGDTNVRSIVGMAGSVVGWGGDGRQKTTTIPTLVNATIVAHITCLRSDIQFVRLTSNRTICAGNLDGSGPCTGDSGSGLMIKYNNKWMLRGTVSAGPGTAVRPCLLNEYTIYSDVAKFMDWIQSNMLL